MEFESWSRTLFDGTSPGAAILAAGYGIPSCDYFADDIDIIETLQEIDKPEQNTVSVPVGTLLTLRPSRRRTKALIRPRVPKDRVVLVTCMREAEKIDWTLPRSRKIPPSENAANVARIAYLESVLRKAGSIERALIDRPPEPFKYDFVLPDTMRETRLKRRAVDYYNKQQFRWNYQEVRRLEEFASAHKIDI